MITVLSHRSGETDDNITPHIAVGMGCDYVKLGISGERVVKLNEMIRIEEKIENSIESQYTKISSMSQDLMRKLA